MIIQHLSNTEIYVLVRK